MARDSWNNREITLTLRNETRKAARVCMGHIRSTLHTAKWMFNRTKILISFVIACLQRSNISVSLARYFKFFVGHSSKISFSFLKIKKNDKSLIFGKHFYNNEQKEY